MSLEDPIIIVDDDVDDHYFYRKVCENIGVRKPLVFFQDGESVLKYLKTTSQNPFIILCDINMPLINGLELRKKINDDPYLRKKSIPFVFFSTAASPHQVREAFDLNVQGFFIKEQSLDNIESTLRVIIRYWEKCKHPNTMK